ncbi:MAG: hypothetical protein JJV89_03380 [Desulfosarcina sp.]|nr:hypothetical protein [Desulfobacterales bacterium]
MGKTNGRKKLILSIVALCILIISYSSGLDWICQKTIDKNGKTYFTETCEKAVYTYGIARIANGLISTVQATQVNASPAGIGLTIGIGEVLDPINDLIERFSLVMLFSLSSLGIQLILMELGSWIGFKILLSLSMIIFGLGIWYPTIGKLNLRTISYKLILISIVVRFCIPIVGVFGNLTDDLFLNDRYEKSTQSLESFNTEINEINTITEAFISEKEETVFVDKSPKTNEQNKEKKEGSSISEEPEKESNFFDTVKSVVTFSPIKFLADKVGVTNTISEKIKLIKEEVANIIPHLIDLIVIFIIKTILIPLFVLWLLLKIVGYIAGNRMSVLIEEKIMENINKESGGSADDKIESPVMT